MATRRTLNRVRSRLEIAAWIISISKPTRSDSSCFLMLPSSLSKTLTQFARNHDAGLWTLENSYFKVEIMNSPKTGLTFSYHLEPNKKIN